MSRLFWCDACGEPIVSRRIEGKYKNVCISCGAITPIEISEEAAARAINTIDSFKKSISNLRFDFVTSSVTQRKRNFRREFLAEWLPQSDPEVKS